MLWIQDQSRAATEPTSFTSVLMIEVAALREDDDNFAFDFSVWRDAPRWPYWMHLEFWSAFRVTVVLGTLPLAAIYPELLCHPVRYMARVLHPFMQIGCI